MALPSYSGRTDEILVSRKRNAPKAELLLDEHSMLRVEEERSQFVAALIH